MSQEDKKVDKKGDRSVCDTKVLFDTLWEAERMASRVKFEAEVYRCPGTKHYHITHKKIEERIGFGSKVTLCPVCGELKNKRRIAKHITRCKSKSKKENGVR